MPLISPLSLIEWLFKVTGTLPNHEYLIGVYVDEGWLCFKTLSGTEYSCPT